MVDNKIRSLQKEFGQLSEDILPPDGHNILQNILFSCLKSIYLKYLSCQIISKRIFLVWLA